MNIAAVLSQNISAGGGFSQALNAVLQMSRICADRYGFSVVTPIRDNVTYLRSIGIKASFLKGGLVDRLLIHASTNLLLRSIQLKCKIVGEFERALIRSDIDLVYFTSPSFQSLALQRLNYVTTVWDLSHRDNPEFPEVRNNNEFLIREDLYRNTLAQALFVLCDSDDLKEKVSHRYGLDYDRLVTMPFSPGRSVQADPASITDDVAAKYRIQRGYFFYPAQFWPHKNHIRILQALRILKNKGVFRQLVLCGSDKGHLGFIKNAAHQLGLQDDVRILGFVPESDLLALYQGCVAVVMPTYFGPTNVPPLEAWTVGKPLIYSAHLRRQVGDAAITADTDSAQQLADAMNQVLDPSVAARLAQNGAAHLRTIESQRVKGEMEIAEHLATFVRRLECWKAW